VKIHVERYDDTCFGIQILPRLIVVYLWRWEIWIDLGRGVLDN